MIEKTALHPVHVARLFGIRNKVYTKVAELSAKALLSREPIAFASLDGKNSNVSKRGTHGAAISTAHGSLSKA